MRRVRTLFWIFTCLMVAGTLLAPSALAQKPVRERVFDEPLEFAAGEVCPFPVRIEPVRLTAWATFFEDGRILVTGSGAQLVTNEDTGGSVFLTTAGSVSITPLSDGNEASSLHGRFLLLFFDGDVGGPGLIHTTGRVDEVFDTSTGAITSSVIRGQSSDVCAELSEM